MTDLTPALRAELASLAGTVAFPGDAAYASLAMPWNVAIPSTPAAVVAVAERHGTRACPRRPRHPSRCSTCP